MPLTTAPTTSIDTPLTRHHRALANIPVLLFVHLDCATTCATGSRHTIDRRCRGERGQATTEYALVLLAAALVGLMVVAWATAGGGAERISRLFNGVIDAVIDRV